MVGCDKKPVQIAFQVLEREVMVFRGVVEEEG